MAGVDTIRVEIAYARPGEQVVLAVEVPQGATLEEAIAASRIGERFPEIDLGRNKVGVFGRISPLSAPLKPGDRVEIYRPLIADPKLVRRQRAAEGRKTSPRR